MTERAHWPEMYDDLWEVYGLVVDEVARLLPHTAPGAWDELDVMQRMSTVIAKSRIVDLRAAVVEHIVAYDRLLSLLRDPDAA